jgi:hypothetical protein
VFYPFYRWKCGLFQYELSWIRLLWTFYLPSDGQIHSVEYITRSNFAGHRVKACLVLVKYCRSFSKRLDQFAFSLAMCISPAINIFDIEIWFFLNKCFTHLLVDQPMPTFFFFFGSTVYLGSNSGIHTHLAGALPLYQPTFVFGSIGVWTQGCIPAKQALLLLEPLYQPTNLLLKSTETERKIRFPIKHVQLSMWTLSCDKWSCYSINMCGPSSVLPQRQLLELYLILSPVSIWLPWEQNNFAFVSWLGIAWSWKLKILWEDTERNKVKFTCHSGGERRERKTETERERDTERGAVAACMFPLWHSIPMHEYATICVF